MQRTKAPLAILLPLLLLVATLASPRISDASGLSQQSPPIVYVVIAIDTEDGDWSWYPQYPNQRDPTPRFDTSNYKRSSTNMSRIFDQSFRDARKDSFGGSFKMSWFAMMDQHYEAAVYKDEGPDHPELTEKHVGYTGVMDTLLRYWSNEVRQAGDGIYWHHHVMKWTGTAWVWCGEIIDGYTQHYEALNHMIIDRSYYPSMFRSGWCWEDSNLSRFLEDWVPFDFTATPDRWNRWKPYHPNVNDPWSDSAPNMERWMARSDPNIDQNNVNAAFEQAKSEGKSLYSFFLHDKNDMPWIIDTLQAALQTAAEKYPGVKFRYVTAQDGMQLFLGIQDRTAPELRIKRVDANHYVIRANEQIWKDRPYVVARYDGGRKEHYERIDVKKTGDKMWRAKIPLFKLLVPPEEAAPEYHPTQMTASSVWNNNPSLGPDRAHDGSTVSYWDSGNTLPAQEPWIQFDLGSVKTIDQVTIQFLNDWQWYAYKVECSTNGTDGSWTKVAEVSPDKEARGLMTHDLSPNVGMRYIKVTVMGSNSNSAHITEIRLFGPPNPDNDPDRPKRLLLAKVGMGANDISGNPGVEVARRAAIPDDPNQPPDDNNRTSWAAYYQSSPPTKWGAGETRSYEVTVTNNGGKVWNASGNQPVRLGVHFGTSSDNWHEGWATDQRFNLQRDVAPGDSIKVKVNVTAPAKVGEYVLRHRMLKEDVTWFNQVDKTRVQVARRDQVIYSSSPPSTWSVEQFQSYQITITNNSGQNLNASGNNPVRLGIHFGTESDAWHNGWATDQRINLPGDIAPGGSATFTVNAVAPGKAGHYVLRHRLVKENVSWFDEIQKTNVTVSGGSTVNYASSPPSNWAIGQTQSYQVTVTNNTGRVWNASGDNPVRLGIHFGTASDGWHDGWAADQRFDLPGDVGPGASVTLAVNVTAPNKGGDYVLRHRMVKEGVTWFDAIQKTSVAVSGTRVTYDSSPPTQWTPGQTQSYQVTIANTGGETWNGSDPQRVRLGIHFGTDSDAWHDGWATDQRFDLPQDLAPGATATLTVAVAAPATGGSYILRHRLVKEGVTWFEEVQKTAVTVGQ